MEPGKGSIYYWLVLDGECRADRMEPTDRTAPSEPRKREKSFGETPFLTGKCIRCFW